MTMRPFAAAILVLWALPAGAVCPGPGPNTTTVPSTGQSLGVVISSPPTDTQVPVPPGAQLVEANCAIGTVAGQPINLLYVVDVSGSTDKNFMTDNGIALVDANGDNVIDALDDFNGDGEFGETLDGEISGVLALNASLGNPPNVRVGVTAFASSSVNADMAPAGGDQKFTVPPQVDVNANLTPDVVDVLRSLRSEIDSGGTIGQFVAKGPELIGNGTNFIAALDSVNATLADFPSPGTNIVYFLSDGRSTGVECCAAGTPTGCLAALETVVAAGTKINTVGVGLNADPAGLQCIASFTGGTFVQVTDPSDLAAVLPSITPQGLGRVEIDGVTVPLDGVGNFSAIVPCPPNDSSQPFSVTATCVADDAQGTSVEACVTLTCVSLCGNGSVDAESGEECDPPNTGTCDATCQRVPNCGDALIDAPEECEPPNSPNCDASCQLIACGNGVVQAGEECEPPSTATCDASCQRVPNCGDGGVDAPETCEPPGVGSCDSDCTDIVCGNDELEPGEECEPPGTATCDATCQRVPVCGDGLLDAPEQCELPGTETCDAECRSVVCGNGIVQPGEECEPANTSTCDAKCQRVPDCGDTYVDAPEECEPPNSPNCDAGCTLIACGDGTVQPGEECEPPSTATCDGSCQRVPNCGDGNLDAPETCDPPDGVACDADCTVIACGNGQVEVGEECDPPNTASCDATCQRVPNCGDGQLDAPETCEPPNSSNCDASCMLVACGNGMVQPGEECDPPNGETCGADCQRVPACGDGLLDPPQEQCEPPNTPTCGPTCTTSSTTTSTTTSTTSTTTLNACGDGAVDTARGEQCDVGTANGGSGSCCDASCRIVSPGTVCRQAAAACDADAVCNGVDSACPVNLKKADGEACDDGDPATLSACRSDVCVGVKVALAVPETLDVPAGAKKVGVPFTINIASNGNGKARVVMQGFVSCAELPAIPATCTTKQCKFLRRQLAAKCGSPGAGTTLAAEPRPGSGQILVTGKFDRQFGRRASTARGELRLNKLGRDLLVQNRTFSLQTNAVVRDRAGNSLRTLIRTLLRLR